MKKLLRNLLTTSAIATSLVVVSGLSANADTTTAPIQPTYATHQSQQYGFVKHQQLVMRQRHQQRPQLVQVQTVVPVHHQVTPAQT